jgi:uncharacterized membrane-anchored protein
MKPNVIKKGGVLIISVFLMLTFLLVSVSVFGSIENMNAAIQKHAKYFLLWRIFIYGIGFGFGVMAYRAYQKKGKPDDARRVLRIMGMLLLVALTLELPRFLIH